ncbi:FG-GAP-like repeat-containing protein, partial [Micromonospora sp. NPDC051300]|uniref:FG-GAP-like repeat-containing protein n=1 Tax=Micromonospora sp. NPDC051300 TaxID=3364286 RepID=UPI003790FD6C
MPSSNSATARKLPAAFIASWAERSATNLNSRSGESAERLHGSNRSVHIHVHVTSGNNGRKIMKKSYRIRGAAGFLALAAAILGTAVAPSQALAAPTADGIVTIAKRELNDSSRNYEIPDNCSYYGGVMFGWPACGGKSGWGGGGGAYAWCAAFAKYVWREGGVTTGLSQIDGYARSFKTYGQNNGTWHARGSYVPRAGDAVVFDWQQDGVIDHVGIVRSVSGSSVNTIEGNTSNRTAAHTYYNYATNPDIVGFTTAVGVTGGTTPAAAERWIADVSGDGFADLVATKSDGSMWMFPNNFNRDGGNPFNDVRNVGSNWSAYERLVNADVTGDGFVDLLGVKSDGTMWLFSNNFNRDGGYAYGDVRQVGSGWSNYARIVSGDVNGDGFTDLLGVKSDGTMWLFSNNFVRDGGVPFGDVRQVGSGWSNYARIVSGDVNGDGFTDLLGVKSDGTMWLFS